MNAHIKIIFVNNFHQRYRKFNFNSTRLGLSDIYIKTILTVTAVVTPVSVPAVSVVIVAVVRC